MEKLKLEHLAPYLPYGLKGINNGSTCNIVGIFTPSEEVIIQIGCIHYVNPNNVKPILRPISDLTKEIEHAGKTFIPYDEIKKLYSNTPQFTEYKDNWIDIYGIMDSKSEYVCVQKLIQWRFDVFGLIEKSLAIDINTCKF